MDGKGIMYVINSRRFSYIKMYGIEPNTIIIDRESYDNLLDYNRRIVQMNYSAQPEDNEIMGMDIVIHNGDDDGEVYIKVGYME